jgi:hypothetical protein
MPKPTIALLLSIVALTSVAQAQQDMSKVEIKTEQLAPGVAVLFGAGGNIGVSYGEDGTVLIDDQFAPYPLAWRPYRWEREFRQGRRGNHGA